MSINMNELPVGTQTKLRTVVADGKIEAEEWSRFSESEQEILRQELGGNIPTAENPLMINSNDIRVAAPLTPLEMTQETTSNESTN